MAGSDKIVPLKGTREKATSQKVAGLDLPTFEAGWVWLAGAGPGDRAEVRAAHQGGDPEDIEDSGYDGALEVGQCLCVEVYVGEVGGPCGIKLEDQVVITEDGYENLTRYPFEQRFLE